MQKAIKEEKITGRKKTIRKIILSVNREMLTFLIINKTILYTDRKFKMLIRIIPKPKNLIAVIQKSRNRIPMFIANLFNFNKAEMDEYNTAQTVDELAEIIIRDGKKNGCILVANGDMAIDVKLANKIEAQEVVI